MICEYTTTLEDFKAAQRLGVRRSRTTAFAFFFFQRFMPSLAVIALALVLWDIIYRHFAFQPWIGALLFAVMWFGFYFPAIRPFQIRRLYRAMKNGRDDSSPLIFELTDNEMISRIPGLSEGRFFAGAVVDFIEDDKVALIYLAKKRFLMIPKRAMPESDWQTVRSWVNQKSDMRA